MTQNSSTIISISSNKKSTSGPSCSKVYGDGNLAIDVLKIIGYLEPK